MMKFFVKDFCETVQATVFIIFGMQVDNDVLYRWVVNQPTPAYSSLYLSIYLFFFLSTFFVNDIFTTV